MSNLVKLFESPIVYVIWNSDREEWFVRGQRAVFAGAYIDPEQAELDAASFDHIILDVTLGQHQDLVRIIDGMSNGVWDSKAEMGTILESKLRQLLTVLVYRNKELRDKLKGMKQKRLEDAIY